MKENVTILYNKKYKGSGLLYFYSFYPFLKHQCKHTNFKFVNSIDYCINKDKNDNLLIVRYFNNNYKFSDNNTTSTLFKLRDKYKKIAIFDDGDRTSVDFPQALPIVDAYFLSQLFLNRDQYLKPIKRGQLYSEYFHNNGIRDRKPYDSIPVHKQDLQKLHLAWNIGAGSYPKTNLSKKIGIIAANLISPKLLSLFYNDPANHPPPNNLEMYDANARFSIPSVNTVGYQRKAILELVENRKNVHTGITNLKTYKQEIKNTKITISPFGWGEVCFRDFEAILNGSLLLKPDMGHIETWPDIYKPYETYIPFRWDARDLIEKVNKYLGDNKKRRTITNNAFQNYLEQMGQLDDKVTELTDILAKS